MKSTLKWLTIIVMLFTASVQMHAQQSDTFKPVLRVGVGAGPVFTTVDFVPSIPQSTNQGFSAGISARYISEKYLGIGAELNYTRRGWNEDFSETETPEYSYSRTLDYVELPILTHVYFGNKVRFILNIGPQISYMLGSSSKMNDALSDYIADERENDPDKPIGLQYESLDSNFDYGLLGGVGIEFNSPIGSFNLEGRYYFGLGDSFDSSRSRSGNFSRSAHRYLSGKLTYYFLSY